MPTTAFDIEWLSSSTPFDTATCVDAIDGRFCCLFVIFGCTRNCEYGGFVAKRRHCVRLLECFSIRVVRFDATLLAHIDIGYDEIGILSMAKGVGSDAGV
jgi:hypothetical protein